jgi:prefoldin alpha subunit
MSASKVEVTEQQVQEELMRLDAYRAQLNQLLQQHQYLSASRGDHARAKESLEGLDRLAAGVELLIPIGGETFVRGSPTGSGKVLIGVGSGIVVELDRPKVIELLADRVLKIDQASQEMEGQIRTLDERVQVLARRIESVTQGGPGPELAGAAAGDVGGD